MMGQRKRRGADGTRFIDEYGSTICKESQNRVSGSYLYTGSRKAYHMESESCMIKPHVSPVY